MSRRPPARSEECEQPHGPGCDGTVPGVLFTPYPCPCHEPDTIPF